MNWQRIVGSASLTKCSAIYICDRQLALPRPCLRIFVGPASSSGVLARALAAEASGWTWLFSGQAGPWVGAGGISVYDIDVPCDIAIYICKMLLFCPLNLRRPC